MDADCLGWHKESERTGSGPVLELLLALDLVERMSQNRSRLLLRTGPGRLLQEIFSMEVWPFNKKVSAKSGGLLTRRCKKLTLAHYSYVPRYSAPHPG
jgi:hypothetical protein